MSKFGFDINDSLVLTGVVSILVTVFSLYYGEKYRELRNRKQRLLDNLYSFIKNKKTTGLLQKIWPLEYKGLFDLEHLEDPNAIYKKSSSFLSTIHFEKDNPVHFKRETLLPQDYIHNNYKDMIIRLHKLVEPIENIDTEIKNLLKTDNKSLIIGSIAILFSSVILFLESLTWSGNENTDLFLKLVDFLIPLKLPFIGLIVWLTILSVEGFVKSFFDS
jgi:hypothetical protein